MPAPMLPGQSAKKSKKLDPELPPQLSDDRLKDIDELVKDLNKCPFFMTKYDDQDGENEALEALKALAYEGEPDEVATNFRNQGNDNYKAKQYKTAIEFYTKGIDVKCGVKNIDSKLYLNRGQSNLMLRNYRKCITDCQKALEIDPTLIKAYFRIGKAFMSISKYQEANDAVSFGLKLSPEEKELLMIERKSALKIKEITEKLEKEDKEGKTFLEAMKVRGMSLVFTKNYVESEAISKKIHLEDVNDVESQFIFDAIIDFPTIEYNCYIDKVGELTTFEELLTIPYYQPNTKIGEHPELNLKNCSVFLETFTGGLTKIGKRKTINEVIILQSPQIPIIDWILCVYVVPKERIDEFIGNWDKQERLSIRRPSGDIDLHTGEIVADL